MAEKGNSKRTRAHKTSQHRHSQHVRRQSLTELEKVLICNGGVGHLVLRNPGRQGFKQTPPKRRGGNVRQERRGETL